MDHTIRKYAEEREKRLRSDGTKQYKNLQAEQPEDYLQDPFVDYEKIRAQEPPLRHGDSIKFLIVGAGHNGLLFAYRLMEMGFRSNEICVIDSAGGFGGTWYWNRYPGAMCDVEASIYLPLLEETSCIPKHRYSFGYEIRENAERIAAHLDLRAMFCTKVHSQVWNEAEGAWTISMKRNLGPGFEGENLTVQARFVFGAWGYFYSPRIPELPGLDILKTRRNTFHTFHTSRWDYAYTGGSQEYPTLVNLKDKKVGIIGTGATGVQVVPELAKWAKHLYVFQRTASHGFPRAKQPTDVISWHKHVAHEEGWQFKRQLNFDHFISDDPDRPADLVEDGWTTNRAYAGSVGSRGFASARMNDDFFRSMLKFDEEHAEQSRAYVDREVSDPEIAEKLKAWYPGWCKRPTFHDQYLSAFNQPNVTLVDTDGKGVQGYSPSGVIVDGSEYDLDVLIFATGFSPSSKATPADRMDGTIIGRNDRSLHDKWRSSDFGTLFGLMSNQFPNMFFYAVAGVGSSPNLTTYYEGLSRLAANILAEAHSQSGCSEKLIIEVSKEAEDRYTDQVERRSHWYSILASCTPGYYNGEGEVSQKQQTPKEAKKAARASGWGGGPVEYHAMIETYINEAQLKGITIQIV
ncbi:hypothetical protein HBH61_082780 [Parastagonospora nodorum]|nr:hypothetical protein HBH61_082780 [Parastagonospora nodorum]